ncbi:MAG: hypothetical protein QOJ53_829 [Sphingomonadales bacterium]|nr:hypothetical protein [Sphingomonadales bacterium]
MLSAKFADDQKSAFKNEMTVAKRAGRESLAGSHKPGRSHHPRLAGL